MLFEGRAKDCKADLFDREEQYQRLHDLLQIKTPLILIKGLRRSGKTSLLKTYLNEEERPYIWVDLRALAAKNVIKKDEILPRFEIGINDFIKQVEPARGLINKLKSINGIHVMGNGITFGETKEKDVSDMMKVFETLNTLAGDSFFTKDYVVLAIDEAQKFSNAIDVDMTQIIATIYDNCKHIIIILSGSEIGLLEKFINNVEQSKALSSTAVSGLSKEIVELPHLSSSQSKEYLESGFKQINPEFLKQDDFNEIISKAVDSFGGVIGWLNNFGVKFKIKKQVSDSYIQEIHKDAMPVVHDEFSSLLSICDKPDSYKKFARGLSLKPKLKWGDIVKFLQPELTVKEIETIRDNLMDYGFIKKIDALDEYYVPDPLCRHYFTTNL